MNIYLQSDKELIYTIICYKIFPGSTLCLSLAGNLGKSNSFAARTASVFVCYA